MLEVREATQKDCNILLRWRNDEHTQSMSRTAGQVSPSDHKKWFEAALEDPLRLLLMLVWHDSQSTQFIGTTRFDTQVSDGTVEVSVTLNPEVRGKGYSKLVLSTSIAHVEKYRKPARYIALIKSCNIASVKAFAAVGFKRCEEKDGLEVYELLRK